MIDLKKMFNKNYRVKFDSETATADRAGHGICEMTRDEWYYTIEHRCGYIAPYGDDELCLYAKNTSTLKKLVKILADDSVRSFISDKDGFIYFPPRLAEKVFAYVRARKRKILSEEQKAKAIKNLTPFTRMTP